VIELNHLVLKITKLRLKLESAEREFRGGRVIPEFGFTGDGSFVILKVSGKEKENKRELKGVK
jgi:hypothetical protein